MELSFNDVIDLLMLAHPQSRTALNKIEQEHYDVLDELKTADALTARNIELLGDNTKLNQRITEQNCEITDLRARIADLEQKTRKDGQIILDQSNKILKMRCDDPECWCKRDAVIASLPPKDCCCDTYCYCKGGDSYCNDECSCPECFDKQPKECQGGCMADFDACVHSAGGPVECQECRKTEEAEDFIELNECGTCGENCCQSCCCTHVSAEYPCLDCGRTVNELYDDGAPF